MFGYGYGMGWWGYACMGVGMVVLWALLIAGVLALIRFIARDQQDGRTGPTASTAQQLLAARFARGEISETEYHDRLTTLREHV
jgi:putative membrane protein